MTDRTILIRVTVPDGYEDCDDEMVFGDFAAHVGHLTWRHAMELVSITGCSDGAIEAMRDRIAALERDLADRHKRVDELIGDVSRAEGEIAGLREALTESDNRIAVFEEAVSDALGLYQVTHIHAALKRCTATKEDGYDF